MDFLHLQTLSFFTLHILKPFPQVLCAEGQLILCQSRVAQYKLIAAPPLPLHCDSVHAAAQPLTFAEILAQSLPQLGAALREIVAQSIGRNIQQVCEKPSLRVAFLLSCYLRSLLREAVIHEPVKIHPL